MLIVVALECVLQHLVCLSKASSVSPGGGKVSVGGGQALPVIELLVGCAPFQQLGDLQQHARCFTRCRNFSADSEDQHPHSPIDWSSCQSRCCSTTDVQCSFEIGPACCGCLRIFGTISTTCGIEVASCGSAIDETIDHVHNTPNLDTPLHGHESTRYARQRRRTRSPPSLTSAVGVGLGAAAGLVGADLGAFTFSPPVTSGFASVSAKAGPATEAANSIPSPRTCSRQRVSC